MGAVQEDGTVPRTLADLNRDKAKDALRCTWGDAYELGWDLARVSEIS
jgi:hypothetical protein